MVLFATAWNWIELVIFDSFALPGLMVFPTNTIKPHVDRTLPVCSSDECSEFILQHIVLSSLLYNALRFYQYSRACMRDLAISGIQLTQQFGSEEALTDIFKHLSTLPAHCLD